MNLIMPALPVLLLTALLVLQLIFVPPVVTPRYSLLVDMHVKLIVLMENGKTPLPCNVLPVVFLIVTLALTLQFVPNALNKI